DDDAGRIGEGVGQPRTLKDLFQRLLAARRATYALRVIAGYDGGFIGDLRAGLAAERGKRAPQRPHWYVEGTGLRDGGLCRGEKYRGHCRGCQQRRHERFAPYSAETCFHP